MITVTAKAANKLREMLEKSAVNNPQAGIRFVIKAGGCSGFSYDRLRVSARPFPREKVFESNGIRVFVDQKSLSMLNGTEIDLSDNLLEGFVFNNPNAKSSCGCGLSFELKQNLP